MSLLPDSPRVLITGRGTSGSWQVRAVQLGIAIGATVAANHDGACSDIAVVVKRWRVRPSARIVIWDVVDAWPQPAGNDWTHAEAMRWLRGAVAALRPDALIAPTRQMAADLAEFGLPVLALPHHARPAQPINTIRDRVATVAYEGAPHYLGRWLPALEAACAARGWRFVLNPPALADADLVVALRDATGYPAVAWKSAVKLANAQGSGTPAILTPAAGYREQQSGAEAWVESPEQLGEVMDRLAPVDVRVQVAHTMLMAAPHIEDVARQYREWLVRLWSR